MTGTGLLLPNHCLQVVVHLAAGSGASVGNESDVHKTMMKSRSDGSFFCLKNEIVAGLR